MKKFSELIKGQDCLFRYRAYKEETLNALEKNRIYFSRPSYFNDPYDNLIYINSEMVVKEIIGNILHGMDEYLERRKDFADFDFKMIDFMWHQDESKKCILKERIKQIYSAIDTVRENIKKNTKVICFAEEYNSMLMWSHYADYHAGFCLVYRKESIEEAKRYGNAEREIINKTVLTRVNYVEQQLDMTNDVLAYIRNNMFDTMGDVPQVDSSIASAKIRQVITEKSKDWAYEKEWRLIPRVPKIETESPLSYIECKPIAVIIGSQCFDENRENLIKICEKIDVPVYGIFLKENDPKCRLELNDDGNLEVERHEYFFCYNG